ncbi:MAG: hypothetical protein UU05_C0002G0040 [Candidatus Curtissbacteria bacterium GW2011_GWA1_40_47]|uniref:Uncharacterized protein n=1 Tax=Candidatus Curtissbacteria bacterium RIFOXYA1_FULL_41_14 TaxID=1797737 RepID=A0A1F5HB36_9BACT|nr:MAG: hypothetical protein UT95_C0001G0041 [Candidatus Curtissbacteria bacterium GW2011_GWB1_40_28]KKR62327.1 MAG: hypothetical protein UU00_C0001G0047 [Microgenomates group bacterium GW2011_GWC1_40_35]KKR66329.1 MAG: hypothetical protein UU05_C0002G0040 [Candidatus Curtissbacteria bacterium GW2011_GWA1_40_47]KKR77868.1 MAG: hypothetical protein UU19_C0001G0014 [Candidatus Curtissbacteria bacterium GW2011_GWD1_40_8]KKS02495.1 MAG: hypothetical protein UU53_C0001G0040 [Candidatus Curtissbacter
MNLRKTLLVLIILLAFILRFYQLGINPPGLYWDEAVFGYDAYSILKTGKDHHGVTLPLFFESFGDWKLPGYHYLLVPSIAIFGLNEFAVRFPSAFFGFLTVPLIYLLTKKLFEKSNVSGHPFDESSTVRSSTLRLGLEELRPKGLRVEEMTLSPPKGQWSVVKSEPIALLSAFFLAISPWHIQFSRGGFESTTGLFFLTFGLYLFLKGIERKQVITLTLAFLLFTLSMYFYHAYRIFTPLFVIVLLLIHFKAVKKIVTKFVLPVLLALTLALPIIIFTFSPEGQSRASSQSAFSQDTYESARIFYDQNSKPPLRFLSKYWSFSLYNVYLAFNNYIDHFSPVFLFYKGDQIGRHSQVDMGQIYLFDGILLVCSIFALKKLSGKSLKIMLSWLILAPIPAMIVNPTPHAYRTLQMSVPLAFFSALGAYWIFSNKKLLIIKVLLTFVIFYTFLTYLHLLFVHYPKKFAADWQDGYREMVTQVQKYQNHFDKVYITNINQVPYIYLLFYGKYDPEKFINSGGNRDYFDKYVFIPDDVNIYDQILTADRRQVRILYVAPSWEKVDGKWLAAANDSTGRHIYSLWDLNETFK